MRGRRATPLLFGLIVVLVLAPQNALAHVSVTPEVSGPDEFATFTFTVPNESDDEDTVDVDVQLPQGFILEDAEQVSGWKTVVDAGADGVPVAVHWQGGSLLPGSFATFALRGRTPDDSGPLAFPTTQRLERTTESWTGPPSSDNPAPTVYIGSTGGAGSNSPAPTSGGALPPVPLASASGTPDAGDAVAVDDLARSRSSLALALAAGGIVAGLAGLAIGLRRRKAPD